VAVDIPALLGPIPDALRPEDHLTLHFFEDLSEDRVPVVVEALAEAAGPIPPFDLEIRGVGAFPTPQRPRVVWAGVGEGSAMLVSLANRVRQGLASRGFPVEARPFVPHLTLARVRSPRQATWASRFLVAPENASRPWGRFPVSELVLKQSELLPSGARHTVRERVRLGPGPAAPPGS
jgi:RNA 2',3'-cyclic 3'-phosphodiesterase